MKPGLKTLITGILLFILGAFVVPFLLILPLFLNDSTNEQFLIPGSKEVTVDKPGRYYLWNDYQTVYNGKSYNKSEGTPDGLKISVCSEDGVAFPFTSDTSVSSSGGASSKRTIGYVDVSEPTKLIVSVSGDSEVRVFSFSKSVFKKIFATILGGGAVSMIVAFVGFGIAIWGIFKLVKNKSGEKVAA